MKGSNLSEALNYFLVQHKVYETESNRGRLDYELEELFSPFKVPQVKGKQREILLSIRDSSLNRRGRKKLISIFRIKSYHTRMRKLYGFMGELYEGLKHHWAMYENTMK